MSANPMFSDDVNSVLQVGDNTTINRVTPVPVVGLTSAIVSVDIENVRLRCKYMMTSRLHGRVHRFLLLLELCSAHADIFSKGFAVY
jgi:hypothetical protein